MVQTRRVFTVGQPLTLLDHPISAHWFVIGVKGEGLNRLASLIVSAGLLVVQFFAGASIALAGDLKVPISRRNLSTPTQKLNREGVAELRHGHRDKAKKLFYKAYLLDPEDPFTLNNLGYMAELDGDADRAVRYYALAAKEHTDAIIDESSERALKGKPLDSAYQNVQNSDHEISKFSEQATVMFEHGRIFEARNLLRTALQSHPQDPFLLNNLGYAMETTGDLEGALRYYSQSASLHSATTVIVTPRAQWRGQPVSEIAAKNARAVNQEIAAGEGTEAATARLNLRGVTALNDNNPSAAREFFLQAYKRDPQNAFTLNNLGYITELDGDWESAQSYYEAARSGHEAKAKVSYSTRGDAEGEKINDLAAENRSSTDTTLRTMQQERRRSNSPVELIQRPASSAPESRPVPPVNMPAPSLPGLPLPGSQQNQAQPQ